jgi:Zn-dependent protease
MSGSPGFDFAIGPFPVRVQWIFLIVAVGMGLVYNDPFLILSWVVIVFVSVLAHELGHAMVAESYGMVPSITLHTMGGMMIPLRNKHLTHLQEILLSLAGPFMGLAIGGVVYLLVLFVPGLPIYGYAGSVISQLLFVNIGWSIFNLLPLLPMDGGHVMRSLWQWLRRTNDESMPLKISIGVGILVVLAAASQRQFFAAILIGYLTYNNYLALTNRRSGY